MSDLTTLYYKDGSSDKVYQASIEAKDGGHVVNFAYGRRGATLTTGCKTSSPVPYDEAKKIYNKLIAEKTAKGYTPGAAGTPFTATTDQAAQSTGVLPQLLNAIEEEEVKKYIDDPKFWMQEKYDGKRMMIQRTNNGIEAINRKGLTCGMPQNVQDFAAKIKHFGFILDGECIGDKFYAFDILSLDGADQRPNPYSARYARLLSVLDNLYQKEGVNATSAPIAFVSAAKDATRKDVLFQLLKKQNAEGVVFKRFDASHKVGRPSGGGGSQLKFKFVATCSCRVQRLNGTKRSIGLELLDPPSSPRPTRGHWIDVGNCTISVNFDMPKVGDIVEIRYLYAFPNGGSLYQPVYLGVRDDIDEGACSLLQLKYKQGTDTDSDEDA